MQIVQPKAEIFPRMSPLKKIELCARVCYKSEDKITEDSAEKFVRKLVEMGHTSVLEHARVEVLWSDVLPMMHSANYANMPYGWMSRLAWVLDTPAGEPTRFVINARDYIEYAPRGSVEELAKLEDAHDYMSVRFTCDRAIANELVRHRVFSFSQQSSRYVTCQLPEFGGIEIVDPFPYVLMQCELDFFKRAEEAYWKMIEAGAKPQEARNVLPLATKTELIMTGMYSQWAEMLKLRTAKAAHPQMRYLMKLLTENKDFPKEKINYV